MKRPAVPAAPKSSPKVELKVVRIGNSRGVRLPKAVIERYQIKDALVLEARVESKTGSRCRLSILVYQKVVFQYARMESGPVSRLRTAWRAVR